MAEVFIAAAASEDARARALADGLKAVGYDAAAGAIPETEIPATVESAKCILLLWTKQDPTASVAALAAMALERKKLISAEMVRDDTPALFRSGPRITLEPRSRTTFQERFKQLITEVGKLTTAQVNLEALPAALATTRAALLQHSAKRKPSRVQMVGIFAAAVAALFVVGFGAGRVINAFRAGELTFAVPDFSASPDTPAVAATTPAPPPSLSPATLETAPWRESAAQLSVNAAAIKQAAENGDARAQALACLGHLAGVEGFLPSPTAARGFCDAAAASHDPAGLYFSWVLRRTAPHAGLSETDARARLAEAAALNWLPAMLDLGQLRSLETSAAAQTEAGRLFLRAAERGNARGQFLYARWLRDSSAGPRDPAAALPFLEQASAQNQPEALHMLGTLYRDGIGVTADPERARALYERAANQNYPPSMFNLAEMIDDGPNRARAVALYQQLSCMRDERQIQPMAVRRLIALRERPACS
ncbi:MAG: sel1 repeat family protein [Hyphomonadaceae bacterium]|nr:sel1 repeat family protein [Hyphomonadaceae bacterium]